MSGYSKLFKLELLHPYYDNKGNVTEDFLLQPSPETSALLKKYGLLVKPVPNGIVIFYEKMDDGSPFKPFTALKFLFGMKLKTPSFLNFTSLPAKNRIQKHYYHNQNIGTAVIPSAESPVDTYGSSIAHEFSLAYDAEVDIDLKDSSGDVVASQENIVSYKNAGSVYYYKTKFDLKNPAPGFYNLDHGAFTEANKTILINGFVGSPEIFGAIEMTAGTNSPGADYTLTFSNASAVWKYFVVLRDKISGANKDSDTFSISDTNHTPYPSAVSFSLKSSPDSEETKIINTLLNGLPNGAVKLFVSDGMSPIPYYQTPKKNLVLKRNSTTNVISNLPNPAVTAAAPNVFVFID